MADLYGSRALVRLNDGTADANNAGVVNAAPGASDYALEVRQVGLPAAAALADAHANPTTVDTATFLFGYNGTTWDRLRSSIANGLAVDVTRVTGTVTVDTELAAAVAQADGTANPTIPNVGAFDSIFNGTTWDRRRSVVAALDSTGTGIAAAGILGQFDDAATASVTENQFAPVRISSRRALLVEGVASGTPVVSNITQIGGATLALGQTTMAASIPVTVASNQGNINVNLAASAATVTVDSELLAPAALADAIANPTITQIAGYLMGYNGTTWDRVRTANTGRLQVDVVTGGGSNASVLVDNAGFTDGTSSVTALGGYFDEVAGTALTENDIAAVRIDSKRALIAVLEDATTRGQRLAISAAGRMSVDLTGVGGSALAFGQGAMVASIPVVIASNQTAVTVDTELPAAAALTDAFANPTAPGVGAFLMGWNSTTWDRLKSTTANGLVVDVSRVQGTVTVDSELPAAAALADAVANPTVPAVGSYLVGFNGTTWDRVRTANTGRLQVDVVTGGGTGPASGVPTGYNLIGLYGTTAAVAGGATQTAVVTNTPANTKTFFVKTVVVAASGQTKYQVKFGATVLATGFNPQTNLTGEITFDPPLTGTGDGSTALTVDVTNREASAMDVYAGLRGWVLA